LFFYDAPVAQTGNYARLIEQLSLMALNGSLEERNGRVISDFLELLWASRSRDRPKSLSATATQDQRVNFVH
jgi:hypothetical protein